MRTDKIDKIIVGKGPNGNDIVRLSTYVRVKRNKKYWKVLVSTEYQLDTIHTINLFLEQCDRVKYLWILPGKIVREQMIRDQILMRDDSLLSNKETFLLRTFLH